MREVVDGVLARQHPQRRYWMKSFSRRYLSALSKVSGSFPRHRILVTGQVGSSPAGRFPGNPPALKAPPRQAFLSGALSPSRRWRCARFPVLPQPPPAFQPARSARSGARGRARLAVGLRAAVPDDAQQVAVIGLRVKLDESPSFSYRTAADSDASGRSASCDHLVGGSRSTAR